jgi:hypothetical protein
MPPSDPDPPRAVGSASPLRYFSAGSAGLASARSVEIARWRHGRGVDQPDRRRPLYRLAPLRDSELALDRNRLRLHGPARDVLPLRDLSDREMCREQRQHAQLGLGQQRSPVTAHRAHRADLITEPRGLLDEHAECGNPSQELVAASVITAYPALSSLAVIRMRGAAPASGGAPKASAMNPAAHTQTTTPTHNTI